MKLVTTVPISPEHEQCLLAVDPRLRIVVAPATDAPRLLQEAADADIIAGDHGAEGGDIFRRAILGASRLRWVHTSSAGVDGFLGPEFQERGFVLTSGKGESIANLLAEHAMALLLALTRSLVVSARQTTWTRDNFPGFPNEIGGLTMGIVGYGSVGQALASRAKAFGMSILAIRSHPLPAPPEVEAVWGPDALPALLGRSDVVVLLLPHTPQTARSFGEAQLRQMRRSAYLINVGRGQVMDGIALERALVEGWIAGAGLDVMPEEPWPAGSPLWHMDNVLITPHIAGDSPLRAGRDMQAFCANFARFVQGQSMRSVVNLDEQY